MGFLRTIPRPLFLLALALATAIVALPTALAQDFSGRMGLSLPDRNDAGTWDGTWYYMTRDTQVALWIRSHGRAPEVRLQYHHETEGFLTDWSGQARYTASGKPGVFSMTLSERDPNTIRAKWFWELGRDVRRRTESAWVTLYRAADGRSLVMNFEELERALGDSGPRLAYEQVWVFRKASNREVRWEELPF